MSQENKKAVAKYLVTVRVTASQLVQVETTHYEEDEGDPGDLTREDLEEAMYKVEYDAWDDFDTDIEDVKKIWPKEEK